MQRARRAPSPVCSANIASQRSRACSAANACRARRSRTRRKCSRAHREGTLMSLELILITGMSGSGKSVALRALEDAGYYCVDNLPPELLRDFVALEKQTTDRVAIAMDVRSATSLPIVPQQLRDLASQGVNIRSLSAWARL